MATEKYKHQAEERNKNDSNSFLFGLFVNYLKPSVYLNSINEIDLGMLKKQGIKLIICDLDNTLVPHFTKFPTKNAKNFVRSVKDHGFKFVLVSNNTNKRVSFFSEKLGLEDYISNAKKPFPWAIKKTIKRLNVDPSETIIIGDMLVTDTLAANFVHCESILVQPLIDPERTMDKFLTWVEAKVFKRLSNESLIVKAESSRRSVYSEDYEIL